MLMDWKDFRKRALDLVERGYVPVYGDFCQELEEIVVECLELAEKKA